MILGAPITSSKYPLGSNISLLVPVNDSTITTYTYTVFAFDEGKYLDAEFKLAGTSSVQIPATNYVNFPNSVQDYLRVPINTYYLLRPDFLNIHLEDSANPADSLDIVVQAGEFAALAADTITLYGFLYDTYGEPIKHEPITFTVLNSASYFDNSPVTTLNATTLTDHSGRFEIQLNRRYDYILSISRLNYTKVLKVSEVPDSVTSLEVLIGRGLVCD